MNQPQIIYTTFAGRLRYARKIRGLTQQELAEKSGLANTHICNYERGDRAPNINNLAKLTTALNFSSDFLIGATNDGHPQLTPINQKLNKILSQLNPKEVKTIENLARLMLESKQNKE